MKREFFVTSLWLLGFAIGCKSQEPQHPDAANLKAVKANDAVQVYAAKDGNRSVVYVVVPGAGSARRLSVRPTGWETDPVVSRSGQLVAYALAEGEEAKSEVWVSGLDGSHAHRVSAPEEDATMPAFGSDDHTILYVKSRFTGHYSPIARPRRHEFDLMKTVVDADGPIAGSVPIEVTQQHFFDLRSLSISPDGKTALVSTSGYPIGALMEEFELDRPLQVKRIFQPHVPNEPSTGASFGGAAYTSDGMHIVFTAATEGKNGMFDYNVYEMSDVTGGELVMLATHSGVLDDMTMLGNGTIVVTAGSNRFTVDRQTHTLQAE